MKLLYVQAIKSQSINRTDRQTDVKTDATERIATVASARINDWQLKDEVVVYDITGPNNTVRRPYREFDNIVH